jgi:transposase InsO family protein
MYSGLVVDALNGAVHRCRGASAGVIFCSDRGSQYKRRLRRDLRSTRDPPVDGTHWSLLDDAAAESFFSTRKRELARQFRWRTAKELKQGLFQRIETWYNRRLHSSIGYRPPVEAYQAHQPGSIDTKPTPNSGRTPLFRGGPSDGHVAGWGDVN